MRCLVSTRKGLFVYGADGRCLGRHFLGDNVSLTLADRRSGRWYAALDHGHFGVKLHRSDDQGATWTEIAAPKYPQREPDASAEKDWRGETIPWDLKRIWALEPGAVRQPGRLWCGTVPGGLFVSDDHGDSWRLIESLWNHPTRPKWGGAGFDWAGLHSICVDPRDPRTVRIAVSTGGLWFTTDDGATWTNPARGLFSDYMPFEQREDPISQDVHHLVQCQAQPDRLWIQHHNGVFRSIDGGLTWTHCANATPSGFGFAVAVHPQRGDTAWFVPAIKDEKRMPAAGQVVVSRTSDGGGSWQVLRDGLPQHDAYDLTYRHGLDVTPDGNGLVFGSTTGSLWFSADGGDHWALANAHLPPIYAVRWV